MTKARAEAFSAGVFAIAAGPPADANAAAVVYGLTSTAMGVTFSLFTAYARSRKLIVTPFSVVGFSTGLVWYPAATLVSAFNASLGLAIFVLVAIFYNVLPLSETPTEGAPGERPFGVELGLPCPLPFKSTRPSSPPATSLRRSTRWSAACRAA